MTKFVRPDALEVEFLEETLVIDLEKENKENQVFYYYG